MAWLLAEFVSKCFLFLSLGWKQWSTGSVCALLSWWLLLPWMVQDWGDVRWLVHCSIIILTADRIVPRNLPASDRDLDLTFREELWFSEAEIDLARQSAIDFFNTRFGLDFSQTDPNISKRRVFQNATFEPFFLTVPFTASVDHWLVNGNTRSGRCFERGFVVDFKQSGASWYLWWNRMNRSCSRRKHSLGLL